MNDRRTPTFSQELEALRAHAGDRKISIREVLSATQGRGTNLLLLLVSLPFVTPIPLPGLSTPFGLLVLIVGTRLALGRKPWLPNWILDREMPPRFFGAVMTAARRIVRCLEILLRPRMRSLVEQSALTRLGGIMIMVSGALLLLPLPIPFTNALPAITVILITASTLERDGLCLIMGAGAFLCTLLYFALLIFGGAQLLNKFLSLPLS